MGALVGVGPRDVASRSAGHAGSAVVALPMGEEPAPLGLDRPLQLLGGGARLSPRGMASEIGIDHVPGLRTFVAEACRAQTLAGRDWYQQPPLALLGPRGAGKGFVSCWIARHAGLPIYRMRVDGACPSDPSVQVPTEREPPALPLIAMAASRCANPVVVVELDFGELDAGAAEERLLAMIDPRRNARWTDAAHDAFFDLSHVSWIVEAHGRRGPAPGVLDRNAPPAAAATLPPALKALIEDAGTVMRIDAGEEREDLRRLDIAAEICAAMGAFDHATTAAAYRAMDALPRHRGATGCAELVREACLAVAQQRAHAA